jgi:hypothetical protein
MSESRIIELGQCVDNRDPLGLGRIRVQTFSGPAGPAANLDYVEWDDKDPFIALPFLPVNINYIPLSGQTVKIIYYDNSKDVVNKEYISGPFTTTHDFNSQQYSSQVKYTTYGGADKDSPKIVNSDDGQIIDDFAKGSIANYNDYGIYGKYGSDVLLTENGLTLRGGKFLPKSVLTNKQITNRNLQNKPVMSDNISAIYLKKFDELREYKEDIVTENYTESRLLKSIVEYNIDNFSGGTVNVDFYVYLVRQTSTKENKDTFGGLYNTSNPNLSNAPIYSSLTQLITTGSTNPTFTLTLTGIPSDDMSKVYIGIRKVIKRLHQYGSLKHIDNTLPHSSEDLHPFYFRPTTGCTNSQLSNTTQTNNRINLFNNIIIGQGVGPKSGLIYSKTRMTPLSETRLKKVIKLKVTPINEQTFGAIKSDKIYLISPKTKVPTRGIMDDVTGAIINTGKPIDFKKLDKYELSHNNYMVDIEPSTYSTVRGEYLVEILKAITKLIYSHQHNVVGPPIPTDPNYIRLMGLMETLSADILNTEIRIN